MWKLNILLNNQCTGEKIKNTDTNENEITTYQNLQNTAKRQICYTFQYWLWHCGGGG